MPAEWSRHQATWFSWPHNPDTWPGVLPEAEAALAEAVKILARGEDVFLNVLDGKHEAHVRHLLGDLPRIRFCRVATNDAWCRDHGAIIVTRDGPEPRRVALNWGFNAWGGKYPPYDLDDAVPPAMAAILGLPHFTPGMILEGGAIDVNGDGLLLTTESCLLAPTRNPGLGKAEIESRLKDWLGVSEVLWLPGGDIHGDDTDGHVDNLARFTAPRTIVAPRCQARNHPDHDVLAHNFRCLELLTDAQGNSFELVALPVPDPVRFQGALLPASYANFLIANDIVLMPAYGQPADALAAAVLEELFPNREIHAVDCRAIIVGLGALHCLSQQIPA